MEPQTVGVQVKVADKIFSDTAIARHDEDIIILRIEKPQIEIRFNYVPMLEFLYGVEKERKKVKIKKM